jgi:hypothetical protein
MGLVGLHCLEAAADESWDAPIRRASCGMPFMPFPFMPFRVL